MRENETCQWCQESGIRHDASDYCEGCGMGVCNDCIDADGLVQDEDGLYFCEPCFNAEQRLRTEAERLRTEASACQIEKAILHMNILPEVPGDLLPNGSIKKSMFHVTWLPNLQSKSFASQNFPIMTIDERVSIPKKASVTPKLPELEIDFYDAFTMTVEQCIDHRTGASNFQRKVDDE